MGAAYKFNSPQPIAAQRISCILAVKFRGNFRLACACWERARSGFRCWDATSCWSERLGKTRLLQDCVGSVSGLDVRIHGEVRVADRAVPYFMVASPPPHECAAGREQELLQIFAVADHQ